MSSGSNPLRLVCPACRVESPEGTQVGALCKTDGHGFIVPEGLAKLKESPLLGVTLNDNYVVYDIVGRGGMGIVYKAIHRRLDRVVAVKTIHLSLLEGDEREEVRSRFAAEARSLSKLRHPGIVTVYDYGERDGTLYMILEFIEGSDLWSVLKREGHLQVERAVPIVKSLLESLQVPHAVGLVHRDIKPSNVMLERVAESERVVLIDFGIAKLNDQGASYENSPQTRTGVVVGTPKYMAPEQLKADAIGPWTDQYAVGCLLYRMLSGASPFVGSRAEIAAAHLRDAPPLLPNELNLQPFDAVIQRAMAKDPSGRFSDNEAFIEAMVNAWVKLAVRKDVRITAPNNLMATMPEFRLPDTHTDNGRVEMDQGPDVDLWADEADPTETSQTNLTGAMAEAIRSSSRPAGKTQTVGLMILAVLFIAVGGLALADLLSEDLLRDGGAASRTRSAQAVHPTSFGIKPNPNAEVGIGQEPAQVSEESGQSGRQTSLTPRAAGSTKADVETESSVPIKETAPTTRKVREASKRRSGLRSRPVSKRARKSSRRKSAKRRRGRTPAKARGATPATSPDEARLLLQHLKSCRCKEAKKALVKLKAVNPETAKKYEDRYNLSCAIIGVGCQSVQQGKSP